MASDPQQASSDADAPAPESDNVMTHRPRTKEDFQNIQLHKYVNKDLVHTSLVVGDQEYREKFYVRIRGETEDYRKVRTEYRQWFPPSRLYGEGYNGYGNGKTDGQAKLVYPSAKPRLGHRKTQRLRMKRKDVAQQAEETEELVPIRLDIEWDKIKLRDTFTWNIHDRTIPPELFAAQLVEDMGIAVPPGNQVLNDVHSAIRDQLNDFYPQVYIEEDALDPELPYSAYKNEEMRILIKLNITIGPHTLEDKFEWEINNPLNSPEEFAQSMTRELSLPGEFTTAIAHCIREQSQLFTRSLYIVGHPFDGRPLEDADLISSFLPTPIPSVFRPQQAAREFGPYLYELTEADLERSEVIFMREQRRQKRSVNRRGGPTLPDLKDRQRTVRTLVVSTVIPGEAETIEESRLYKRVGKAGKRGMAAGGDLSDSSDEEDSGPDSPAMTQINAATTTRTRTMRGAATAASQRMANLGRSETPEAILHHHETRTSVRKFGGRDMREESLDSNTLIIKLRVGRDKLRKFERDNRPGSRPSNVQTGTPNRPSSAALGTPATGGMGPPSTPGAQNSTIQTATTPATAGAGASSAAAASTMIGWVDAPPPPPGGQQTATPPPPPQWLSDGLKDLLVTFPNDRFGGTMRYTCVNTLTNTPCQAPQQGASTEHVRWMYLPRIRCLDCPGKLYTPGPDTTVGNFEVHLKNKQHRERVTARIGSAGGSGSGGAGFE